MILRMLVPFVIAAMLGYVVTLHALPGRVMEKATEVLGETAVGRGFYLSSRITPESQRVVRSSPDLAYSICILDLTQGSWELSAEPWDSYASLSVFAANTDNVATLSMGPDSLGSQRIVIGSGDEADLKLEGPNAIALIRRLAPTEELYAEAARAAQSDVCRLL